MPQSAKSLIPLLIHAGFCLLSASLLKQALSKENYLILAGLPLVFLVVVLPTLYFGWPPPFGYLSEPLEQISRRRALLVSAGALLVAYASFSLLSFGSRLLGLYADMAVFAMGGWLLYVAHSEDPVIF